MKEWFIILLCLLYLAQAVPLSTPEKKRKQISSTRGKRQKKDIADNEVRTIISAIVDAILDGDKKKRSEVSGEGNENDDKEEKENENKMDKKLQSDNFDDNDDNSGDTSGNMEGFAAKDGQHSISDMYFALNPKDASTNHAKLSDLDGLILHDAYKAHQVESGQSGSGNYPEDLESTKDDKISKFGTMKEGNQLLAAGNETENVELFVRKRNSDESENSEDYYKSEDYSFEGPTSHDESYWEDQTIFFEGNDKPGSVSDTDINVTKRSLLSLDMDSTENVTFLKSRYMASSDQEHPSGLGGHDISKMDQKNILDIFNSSGKIVNDEKIDQITNSIGNDAITVKSFGLVNQAQHDYANYQPYSDQNNQPILPLQLENIKRKISNKTYHTKYSQIDASIDNSENNGIDLGSSTNLKPDTYNEQASSRSEKQNMENKRTKFIEQIVSDMAESAVESVNDENEAGVIKKSYVDGQDENKFIDLKTFSSFSKTPMIDIQRDRERPPFARSVQKRSSSDANSEKNKFDLIAHPTKLVVNVPQDQRSITTLRLADEENLEKDLLKEMHVVDQADMKNGRQSKIVDSVIKDFEGLTTALTNTEGLNLHKHEVIAKKLERDLLTHLNIKGDGLSKILQDEVKLMKHIEAEFPDDRIGITKRRQ